MDGRDGVNARLQFGYDALVDFPSLGMSSNSMPNRVSGMAPFNPIFGYDRDPLNQMEYLQSSSLMSYCQYGNGNPQHQQHPFLEDEINDSLAQDQFVSTFFEGRRIFSAMVCPFGVSEVQTYCSNWEGDSYGESLIHAAVSQECKISEEEAVKSSPKERGRKRGTDEWQGDPSKNDNDVPNQKDEKKQKVEGDPSVKSSSRQEGARRTSGTSKPNYVHVRARQGQATISHTLAERVRREKISERMRVLQELVPGCSKIAGKTVILDEIINYVQSLQRQVEFMVMKLATVVNSGITVDLESAVSKHLSDSGGATSPGVGLYPHVPPGSVDE